MVAANVVARFTADTGDFHRKMGAAQNSFTTLSDAATMSSRRIAEVGNAMADAGKKMTVGITLPLAGVGAAAATAAISFESSMNKIIGLVGIASNEVANMSDEVLAMAGDVGKAPDELANGLFVVTSAGLRGSEAMSTLRASAKAGAAGLGETNDIARAVSGALSAYGSDVLSAAAATDAIVATARAGNFETSQFAAAIGRVLPFAQQAGASFQDMGGAVALLTRVNGNASESVTQMLALFRAFVVPTEEAKKALDDVGMSAADLRDSIAERGLPETLHMLDRALGGNREQLGRLLGSSEAASAAFQILNADASEISSTFGVVQQSAGMTSEAFNSAAQTTQFQMSQAMSELKAALVEVGESLLPLVRYIADFAQRWISTFNSLPAPLKNIMVAMAALVAAIGPLLLIAGKLIVVFSTLFSLMMKVKAFQVLRNAFVGMRGELALTRTSMKQTQASMGTMAASAQMAKTAAVGSFRAIGTAARGLLAALGPIGIALIGAGVAMEVLSGRSAATEKLIGELRDTTDEATTAINGLNLAAAVRQLRSDLSNEDIKLLGEYGISITDMARAALEGGDAAAQMQARLEELAHVGYGDMVKAIFFMGDQSKQTFGIVKDNFAGMVDGANTAREANEALAESERETAVAVGQMEYAQLQSAIASGNVAAAYPIASQAADEYGDAAMKAAEEQQKLNETFDVFLGGLSEIGAVDRARDSIGALGESAVENGTKLMGAGENAEAFRSDVIRAFEDSARKATILGKTAGEQREIFTGELIQIVAALRASGVKDSDIEEFLGAMNDLPAGVTDIMQMAVAAIGETDYTSALEKSFDRSVKAGAPMTADAMERMAEGASQKAKERLGLTLEPELKSIIENAGRALREPARESGRGTGTNIASGMAAGITAGSPIVQRAVERVIREAKAAADAAAESQSPSRLFAETGDDMAAGVALGLRRSTGKATAEATRLARAMNAAFAAALRPTISGPAGDAFSSVFGSREDIRNSARALQDATWALADARDAVAEAEQRLSEARKEGNAREVAAAERDLARARRDAADAADAAKTAEFVAENQKALIALDKIVQKYDYITASLQNVQGALQGLAELSGRAFGLESDLFRMFSTDTMDPRTIASNFRGLTNTVREAFGVLTDPKIVGAKQARANRREMNRQIKEIESLAARAIQLRQQYDANLQEIARLEKDYQQQVSNINTRYNALEKDGRDNLKRLEDALRDTTSAYEEENRVLQSLINERDSFVSRMAAGFRSFVNDFARDAARGASVVERSTRRLANGITVTLEREVANPSGLRGALESRLAEIRTFSANIRTLMERGLDPALVRDFVSAGVSGAGDTVAALTAASDEDLQAINAVQVALAREAEEFGGYVSEAWFNAGIASQQAIVTPLEQAVTDAQAAVNAARSYLDQIAAEREAALTQAANTFNTEKARLEAENETLLARMDEVATEIEASIAELMATLPVRTAQAGREAMSKMLEGFRERFPSVYNALNRMMTRLANSMNRTATVTIRTVYAAVPAGLEYGGARARGGPVTADKAYLVGERGPELFLPGMNGNIVPNNLMASVPSMSAGRGVATGGTTINVTVNAGMGADGAEVGRKVVDALRQYQRRNGPIPVKVAG